jgi:hypothetical protein
MAQNKELFLQRLQGKTNAPPCPSPAPSETQHKTCREEKALQREAHQEVRFRLRVAGKGCCVQVERT